MKIANEMLLQQQIFNEIFAKPKNAGERAKIEVEIETALGLVRYDVEYHTKPINGKYDNYTYDVAIINATELSVKKLRELPVAKNSKEKRLEQAFEIMEELEWVN